MTENKNRRGCQTHKTSIRSKHEANTQESERSSKIEKQAGIAMPPCFATLQLVPFLKEPTALFSGQGHCASYFAGTDDSA
jgi:hypothetical protein